MTVAIPSSPVFSPSSSSSSMLSSSIYRKPPPESSSPSPAFQFRLPNDPLPTETGFVRNSTSTLSKRKRPAKIAIPIASLSFSEVGMPSQTAEDDRWKEVVVDGDGYAVYCKKGKREFMEDRFKAVVESNEHNKQAFFGVYDGHGGSEAAEFVVENLDKNILKEVEELGEIEIMEAVKRGYMSTDSQCLNQGNRGGSCCVTAIIRDNNLVVSNAGDCRAVVSVDGTAMTLTYDHRPSRHDEKLRIEKLGGYVDYIRGVPRVLGSLSVSRAIGDRSLKQWVIAEPESKVVKIAPEFEFLIMASDGLWDKVSNQEAVDLARSFCIGNDKLEPVLACKKLVELSASRGSIDDISVMIVHLGRF